MRNIALAALLMLAPALGAAQDDSPQRPISGAVSAVDPGSHRLSLGAEEFVVPKGVYDLSKLSQGTPVIVHWEKRGGDRVATQIERPAGD